MTMGMKLLLWSIPAVSLLTLSYPSAAQTPAASGALLAAPCAECHGQDGKSPGSIVGLYGRPTSVLGELLENYRTKALTGTVMNRIAAGYTPEQLKAIAAHLGTKE
jgi:cytochrome subunit of sulfide dehydrogenase